MNENENNKGTNEGFLSRWSRRKQESPEGQSEAIEPTAELLTESNTRRSPDDRILNSPQRELESGPSPNNDVPPPLTDEDMPD
jgi:hypothetical protein